MMRFLMHAQDAQTLAVKGSVSPQKAEPVAMLSQYPVNLNVSEMIGKTPHLTKPLVVVKGGLTQARLRPCCSFALGRYPNGR